MTIPPPPARAQPGLVLELRRPFHSGWGPMVPVVAIDGHPAPAGWGTNAYPAPVGRRHVRVSTRYLSEFGIAEADVDVLPGQTSVLHDSSPLMTFLPGRIGPTEQPRPGGVFWWVVLAVVVLIVLATVVAAVLSS